MTSEDIINSLDSDKIKCFIANKWVKLKDDCIWYTSPLALSQIDYLKCIDQCPKILWHNLENQE